MTNKKEIPEGLQLLHEWSKRLGLEDWFIVLRDNVLPEDMGIEGSSGVCEYIESTKCATIKIVNPSATIFDLRGFDYEAILVHELLHCKLCLAATEETDTIQFRIVHQIIDDLARALVDAKRSGKKELIL
jgi:hypothetical protein